MEYIKIFFVAFWGTLCEMSPFLLFGFIVAGVLSILISPEIVEKHLGGKGIGPIFKASLFGVPLPLCSCGVIPVAVSLRRHGSSKGATTAFLLSTPQTGVDSIMVTLSLLGPVFAIFRPLAAFITGMVGGSIVELFAGPDDEDNSMESCADECCVPARHKSRFMRAMEYGFRILPRDIGKPLLIGLAVAGMISAVVPNDFFSNTIGTGVLAMIVMMLVGIPVYVCATASIPLAAAMMLKGASPGAALVFLMTGPATNVAAITILWKVMGRKSALMYLAVVAGTALCCGLALDFIFDINNIRTFHPQHWMLPQPVKALSAVLLLGIVISAVFGKQHLHDRAQKDENTRTTLELKVHGMKCSQCADHVQRALVSCSGVSEADVDLDRKLVTIHGDAINEKDLIKAISSLGYSVKHDAGTESHACCDSSE